MLYTLIVIYNKECEDSLTLQKLQQYGWNHQIIIFDNSTIPNNNQQYSKSHGIIYYGFKKNYGLSYAYNYVIKKLGYLSNDYLMIMDDDTNISKAYLKAAEKQVEDKIYDVILPIVKVKDFILSPCNVIWGVKSNIIQSVEQINPQNFTAINSGMIVRMSVYKKFEYDENLFLDCVDHDFMKMVMKENLKVKILNVIIVQNYSREDNISFESTMTRFKIFKKDLFYYCKKNKRIIFYLISIIKLKCNYIIKFHKLF